MSRPKSQPKKSKNRGPNKLFIEFGHMDSNRKIHKLQRKAEHATQEPETDK